MVNWDAAIDKKSKKMSINIIARDQEGGILATMSASKPHIMDQVVAKALAVLVVDGFRRDLGFQKVVLEGDALQIVQALKTEGRN